MKELTIRTSEEAWVAKLAKSYKNKEHVLLVDDAHVGIDPSRDTILMMGKKAHLSPQEWGAVAVSLGVAATGVYLLITAALDPEPFSKIGVTILAGTALTLGGGFSAVRILTGQKPPNIKVTKDGFDISWSDAA
jgi:hypothetical protein